MRRKNTTYTILNPLERGEIPDLSILIYEIKSLQSENQGLRSDNDRLREIIIKNGYYEKLAA